MDELVLNNIRLKLVDGEVWAWKPIKNPYWRKVKYTITKYGYYQFKLTHNKIEKGYMVHRVIYKFNNADWDMTFTPDNEIDHIDNCKSNNNIENLRVVNSSQNSQNVLSTKGYWLCKGGKKYRAKITINYKVIHLGYHDTIEEAREAYLIGKEKYHSH
tara:strand:+ start:424 stop:897 length:474 start_codon:yes stop_codon:yes gene_type:complete